MCRSYTGRNDSFHGPCNFSPGQEAIRRIERQSRSSIRLNHCLGIASEEQRRIVKVPISTRVNIGTIQGDARKLCSVLLPGIPGKNLALNSREKECLSSRLEVGETTKTLEVLRCS